jgi:predicted outer membrane repeat protein
MKRLNLYKLTMLLIAFALNTSLMADTHYVDLSGSNTSPYTTPGTAAHTLTAAIGVASDSDIIDVTGTITEAGITVNKSLTIQGQGASSTIVQAHATQGSATNRVFYVAGTSISVTFSNMTIRHGNITGVGGGIYNIDDEIIISDCIISNNTASTTGGGIYNEFTGSCSISNSTISSNTASTGVGGGIYNYGTISSITNSTFGSNISANEGGGIYNYGTISSFTNSTINNNDVTAAGGAGGGLRNLGTISSLSNCTISGNSCENYGGGIYSTSTISLSSTTIANNECIYNGGGVFVANGDFTIKNTIIGNNHHTNGGETADDYYYSTGTLTDNGYNLVEITNVGAGAGGFTNGTNNDIVGEQANLNLSATLADNNTLNETQTLSLTSGSVAINAGTNSGAPTKDQRDASRISTTDMGAYEYHSAGWTGWTGNSSTAWEITTNWSSGLMPTTQDVTIPDVTNDPVISGSTTRTCNSLDIASDASLTIEDNGNFTISGNLTNNGTLTVQSNSDGTGSLIVSGTSSGNVIFKRYVDEASKAATWHYVSSPVAGQALTTDWMTNNSISFSDPAHQFYRWDEDTYYWIYFDYEGSAPEDFGDESFIEARGYALTKTGAGELSFTGTVRTSDVTYAATYTSGKGEGSNLVGNPFTSAIGVTSGAISTQNFIAQNTALLDDSHEAIYIWDEAAGYNGSNQDYKVISNGAIGAHTRILQDYIQPGQAFLVKVVSGGGDLAFNEDMQAHNSDSYYKNTKELWPSVELIVENNEFFNSTAIGFNENMSFGLDPSFDVGKMKGNPDIALYTRLVEDNGVDFAIQALPPLTGEVVKVKIGLDISQPGNCIFKIKGLENFDEIITIKLEDKETGNLIDFREAEEYSFNISQAGQIRERFVLHFNNATGIEDQNPQTENIRFYVYDNKLYIIDKELKNGIIQLFNILGQPVMEKQYSEVVNTFDLNLSKGYYVVRIITDKTSVSGKIYVE